LIKPLIPHQMTSWKDRVFTSWNAEEKCIKNGSRASLEWKRLYLVHMNIIIPFTMLAGLNGNFWEKRCLEPMQWLGFLTWWIVWRVFASPQRLFKKHLCAPYLMVHNNFT